ncbi:MAG: glucose-6-phosphate isomerase [Spirochaetota bacterium]|nr:MAG: glucose-6-phosphate isomerase [Spirochaetota bacterium]
MIKKQIAYDYNNVLDKNLKSQICMEHEEVQSYTEKTKQVHNILTSLRREKKLPFYDLPYSKDAQEVKKLGTSIKAAMGEDLQNLLVIGIGGSSLGGIALTQALCHPFYNLLPGSMRKGPRLFFAENIDPDEIKGLFDVLDPEKTLINIISKSGSTAEPMANFLIFQNYMIDRIGSDRFKQQVVATTDPAKGTMREIANELGIKTLKVPMGVGGRFSVLSHVGLFPAYMVGIDIDTLLEGAALMDKVCTQNELLKNPAYLNAVIHYHLHTKKAVNMAVLMPYSTALAEISVWYRQLLAESLGKTYALSGEVVYAGQTPIKAVGAIDQHSQIQLYREGPFDKVITVLRVKKFNNSLTIPPLYKKHEGVSYLGGHTLNELIEAEEKATVHALVKSGRPVIEITLPEINPHTIGQLFYFYEVQTVFAGYLYNVNSLDQPGVEAGKQYTYSMLGRKGFEKLWKDEAGTAKRDTQYIIP